MNTNTNYFATFRIYTSIGATSDIDFNNVLDQQRYFDWAVEMPCATHIALATPDGKTHEWSKIDGNWKYEGWKVTVVAKERPWWVQ